MSRFTIPPDPTLAARLRLAALPDGSRVRIIGRPGIYTYRGQHNGLASSRRSTAASCAPASWPSRWCRTPRRCQRDDAIRGLA